MSKILMFARLYEPHVGGVEKHVAGLTAELKKRKHQITIFTEQYDPLLPLKQTINGIRVERIPYSALKTKRAVWKWMESKKDTCEAADLIHIHDVFWWYWPLRFKLRLKPVFITFHGYEGSQPPRWQAVAQRKLAEKFSRGSICIGGFMKKWYHANPSKILYGAANYQPSPAPKNKSAAFWGRLDEDTGIMTYLKAIYLIKPEMTLDIYGEGPQLLEASDYIKKHQLAVANHGWVKETKKAIQKSRYAWVSRYLAILEAMQSQRLVIAVYNNQIKQDYLTCHPQAKNMIIAGNPEELAAKMMAVTAKQEKQMVMAAYEWAKYRTWEHLADEYEALWNK